MKRLLVLSAVVMTASASGCFRNCNPCGGRQTAVYRPCPPVAPSCCTDAAVVSSGPTTIYSESPTMSVPTPTPTLSAPPGTVGPTYPGPETYTPAN